MSVVAAKVTDKDIVIASDSIVIKGSTMRRDFDKLQSLNGIVVGGCGAAEELTLFFEYVKVNDPPSGSVAAIQEFMKNFYKHKEQFVGENKSECDYLLIINRELYEVEGLYVKEVDDYTAIGEGEPYALTALHLGLSPRKAVEVAADLCCYVSTPIQSYVVSKVVD